jgi:hypothetical protein
MRQGDVHADSNVVADQELEVENSRPFIFGLVQAGPESNLATPAQLDTIGFTSAAP